MNEFEFLGDMLLVVATRLHDYANVGDYDVDIKYDIHNVANRITDTVFELNRIDCSLSEQEENQ